MLGCCSQLASCSQNRRHFMSNGRLKRSLCANLSLFGVAVVLLASCSHYKQDSSIDKLAKTRFKTQSYVMEYRGIPIGTHQSSGTVNENREYEFTHSFTHLTATDVVLKATQVLRFAADSPHQLVQAVSVKHVLPDETPYESTTATYNDGKLTLHRDGKLLTELSSGFTLDEYLGLDSWLTSTDLQVDDSISLRVLHLDQVDVALRTWSITRLTSELITVRSSDQIESSFAKTAQGIHLVRSVDASGLVLLPVSDTTDLDRRSRIPTASQIRIPLDEPLQRPKQLSMLELHVSFANDNPGPWASMLTSDGTLLSYDGRARNPPKQSIKKEQQNVPSVSALVEVKRLANEAVANIHNEQEKITALVALAHEYISYESSKRPKSVVSTLMDRSGDCSDIANLLSSLALASGLNARTVYGLVYDANSQTFQMHAWNEFRLNDGQVRSVDATWNQHHTDATHIEFPDANLHDVLRSLENMTLTVVNYEHYVTEA